MAYGTDFTLAGTASFQNQVQMAVFKAANSISNEAATVHPNLDSKRHALAAQVLATFNNTLLMQFVYAAIEAGALSGTPTDAQVDAAISSCWNGVAGVSVRDSTNI